MQGDKVHVTRKLQGTRYKVTRKLQAARYKGDKKATRDNWAPVKIIFKYYSLIK
jgi:hypothetical protein